MHLNGGIGARRKDEAFGEDYGVPNESAGIEISGDALSIRPLTRRRGYKRPTWFDCSCCPVNNARFIPLPAYPWRGHVHPEPSDLYTQTAPGRLKDVAFADTGKGSCRVPSSWEIQTRNAAGDRVEVRSHISGDKDKRCDATFGRPADHNERDTADRTRATERLRGHFRREISLKARSGLFTS